VQAAFTPKELRELLGLQGVKVGRPWSLPALARPQQAAVSTLLLHPLPPDLWPVVSPPPQVVMDPTAFQLTPACEAEMKGARIKKRVYEILHKALGERREG
jgi:hypothetical protein